VSAAVGVSVSKPLYLSKLGDAHLFCHERCLMSIWSTMLATLPHCSSRSKGTGIGDPFPHLREGRSPHCTFRVRRPSTRKMTAAAQAQAGEEKWSCKDSDILLAPCVSAGYQSQFTRYRWRKQDGEQLFKQSMVELLTRHLKICSPFGSSATLVNALLCLCLAAPIAPVLHFIEEYLAAQVKTRGRNVLSNYPALLRWCSLQGV
jgi:hypothetical protein